MEFNFNSKNAKLAKQLLNKNINQEQLIKEFKELEANSKRGSIFTYQLKNNELINVGIYDIESDFWY